MKSFVCVLLGSLLLSVVLAVPNRFSPFAQDDSFLSEWSVNGQRVDFNQREVGKRESDLQIEHFDPIGLIESHRFKSKSISGSNRNLNLIILIDHSTPSPRPPDPGAHPDSTGAQQHLRGDLRLHQLVHRFGVPEIRE